MVTWCQCGPVARTFEVREVRTLPREIVMVEECASIGHDVIEHVARVDVERERGEVLHDDEVGAVECALHPSDRGRRRGVDRETGDDDVGDAVAGDGADVVTERSQGRNPLGRLDGDTVGSPESKADEDDARHCSRLCIAPKRFCDR